MNKFHTSILVFLFVSFSNVFGQNAPSSQASNLLFYNLKPWQLSLSFQPTNANGYLVVKNTSGNTPLPSGIYQRGDRFGDSKVVAFGSGNIYLDIDILSGIIYHYYVFAYNLSGNQVSYNLVNPLQKSLRSPEALDFSSYYSGINPEDTSFISKLSKKLKDHIILNYSNFGFDLAEDVYSRDTSGNEKYVACFYSNSPRTYTGNFSFQNIDFAREHVMPRSWMPTGGLTENADGADFHNLFVVNNPQVNNVRSNYPFGFVKQVTSTYGEATYGRDSLNQIVYEVRDAAKGNVARGIFYMNVAYNGNGGTRWGLSNLLTNGPNQKQNVLLQWHKLDPPDAFEIARHEYIAEAQKNRNPFIDNPHWVCYINFEDMSYISNPDSDCLYLNNPTNTKIMDVSKYIEIYPNPTTTSFFIINGGIFRNQDIEVELYTLSGKLLNKQNFEANQKAEINLEKQTQGMYIVKIRCGDYFAQKKVIRN